jgi:hypothetical protein
MSHLDRLAGRVRDDPFFLGFALAEYARAERLDDAQLAQRLGCPAESLTMLRLCRMPAEEPSAFRADVERIAQRFGASVDALTEVVRTAQVLGRFRQAPVTGSGSLLAARDDETEEQP